MLFDRVFWLAMLVLFVLGLVFMGIGILTWPSILGYLTIIIGGSLMGNAIGWGITGLFAMWWESR